MVNGEWCFMMVQVQCMRACSFDMVYTWPFALLRTSSISYTLNMCECAFHLRMSLPRTSSFNRRWFNKQREQLQQLAGAWLQ